MFTDYNAASLFIYRAILTLYTFSICYDCNQNFIDVLFGGRQKREGWGQTFNTKTIL